MFTLQAATKIKERDADLEEYSPSQHFREAGGRLRKKVVLFEPAIVEGLKYVRIKEGKLQIFIS